MKRKVILIGMDGLMPEQVEQYKADIPEIREFLDDGFFAAAHASPYTCTVTNWNTIATGAWMGTHGVTSFYTHLPGMELGETLYSFKSDLSEAEYFYDAAERQGKRCILINYPPVFPHVPEKSVVIGGGGLHGLDDWRVWPYEVISTDNLPGAKRLFLQPPEVWKNIPAGYEIVQEGVVFLNITEKMVWDANGPSFVRTDDDTAVVTRYILICRVEGQTKLLIAEARDASQATCAMGAGDWSGWVLEEFNGRKGWRQYKVLKLSPDGRQVSIVGTGAGATDGWARPAGLAPRIIREVGPFVSGGDLQAGATLQWLGDEATARELRQMQADWSAMCAEYLARSEEWDALFLQFHCPDGENHYQLRDLEHADPQRRSRADRVFRDALKTLFGMASRIRKRCADDDTLVAIVSDHGCVPIYKYVNVPGILMREGLAHFNYNQEKNLYQLDTKTSQCWSLYGGAHLNVRGREKYGCVEPGEEYEKLRSRIITRLSAVTDPETAEQVFAFVARREDLAWTGMCHPERSEDILVGMRPKYVISPSFPQRVSKEQLDMWMDPRDVIPVEEAWGSVYPQGISGSHGALPNTVSDYSSNRAVLFLSGPGVRKGVRGKTVNLVDVAPTLAHFLGIRPPRQSEGRVIDEAFE